MPENSEENTTSTPTTSIAQDQLQEWINQHQKDFVAHAIWGDNVADALEDGFLKPAELLLREKGEVSYEKGGSYGSRGKVQLVSGLEKDQCDLLRRMIVEDQMPIIKAMLFGIISVEQYEEILKNGQAEGYSIKLSDGCSYPIAFDPKGSGGKPDYKCFFIKGLPYAKQYFFGKDNKIDEHANAIRPTETSDLILYISADEGCSQPLDQGLSQIWKTYLKLSNLKSIRLMLAKAICNDRSFQIFASKLNCDIRCCYNTIAWAYGDVAVLRGNAHEVMSIVNQSATYDGYSEPKPFTPSNGQEVCLLQPFENDGQFFSLDLAEEHTVVIGPKAILASHQAKGGNIKFFAFEDMSEEQLDFFRVPARLRTGEVVKPVEAPVPEPQDPILLQPLSQPQVFPDPDPVKQPSQKKGQDYQHLYEAQEKARARKTALALVIGFVFSPTILVPLLSYYFWKRAKDQESIQKIEMTPAHYHQLRTLRKQLMKKPPCSKHPKEEQPNVPIAYYKDREKAKRLSFFNQKAKQDKPELSQTEEAWLALSKQESQSLCSNL